MSVCTPAATHPRHHARTVVAAPLSPPTHPPATHPNRARELQTAWLAGARFLLAAGLRQQRSATRRPGPRAPLPPTAAGSRSGGKACREGRGQTAGGGSSRGGGGWGGRPGGGGGGPHRGGREAAPAPLHFRSAHAESRWGPLQAVLELSFVCLQSVFRKLACDTDGSAVACRGLFVASFREAPQIAQGQLDGSRWAADL